MKNRRCSTKGCDGRVIARGMCRPCYYRAYLRNGRRWPDPLYRRRQPVEVKPSPLCWADGCPGTPDEPTGLCPEHRCIADDWNATCEEALVTCCFKTCGAIIDPEMFGWEYPCCLRHRATVVWAMELEQWGILDDALRYADCEDWLCAKWIAFILGRDKENRQYLDQVIGETPLFRIVTSALGDLYPEFPFLIPE